MAAARARPVVDPYRWFGGLIVAWCLAWLVHDHTAVARWWPWATVGFWTTAKALVWVLPVLVLVARSAQEPAVDYLGMGRVADGVRAGLTVGLAFVVLAAIVDSFVKTWHWPALTPGTLSALTVAPLFEELMFRGFALRALEDRGWRFWTANGIAALMFLGLHLPGWYFMGSLRAGQATTAASIVVVGLVAGYAKRRGRSTWAAITVHFLNNLYSAFAG